MAETYSSVLFMARECHVYRVPPRKSSAGYRAGDWGDMDKSLWTGRMKIVEYSDHWELFAAAPYDVSGKSVEPVLDSSRYFVLRVESQAEGNEQPRTAFIGVGVRFTPLPSFVSARKALILLLHYKIGQGQTEEDDDDAPPKPSPHLPAGPKQDFSLMDGETLSIKTPALHGKAPQHSTQTRPGFVMPPPPSAKR